MPQRTESHRKSFWFYTGHFHPEYDDYYFAKLRQNWLKNNNGPRTKNKEMSGFQTDFPQLPY